MISEICIDLALFYLPKDGTDWRPRCEEAIAELKKSMLVSDQVNIPSKVAQFAFEKMGREYMERNSEWRWRLSSVAHRHWFLSRGSDPGQ